MDLLEILKSPAIIAFISAVLGGFIGASIKFITEYYVPKWFENRKQILIIKSKYSNPILKSADELLARLENIIENIGHLFSWEDVPGNDSERVLKYLNDNYNINFAESAEISKSPDGETIHISDGEYYAKITIEEGGEYLFSWDDIPGNNNERLIEVLKQNFGIDWVTTAKIEKIDNGKTIKVSTQKNYLSLKLNDEQTEVNLEIDDDRTEKSVGKIENSMLKIYGREKATLKIADGRTGDLIIKNEYNKRNIYKNDWLRPLTEKDITDIPFRRYYYISTIFCFAQLIGWIEILGKEQSYLDFTKVEESHVFNQYMKLIYDALNYPKLNSAYSRSTSKDYWILSHKLRSIGQIMMQRQDGNLYCMDFKTFCEAFRNSSSEFRAWLFPLSRLIENLSDDPEDLRWRRLQITYVILREYINFVDPDHIKSHLKIKNYDEILADPTNIFKAVQKRGETYKLKLDLKEAPKRKTRRNKKR